MSHRLYPALVQEVIDFAANGPLLRPGGGLSPEVEVTTDLTAAMRAAWEESYGPRQVGWTDIRSAQMDAVMAAAAGDAAAGVRRGGLLQDLVAPLRARIALGFRPPHDDVLADLYHCALSRALRGSSSRFFETQFAVYRAGCWPCGWRGDYPIGKMLAFRPVEG